MIPTAAFMGRATEACRRWTGDRRIPELTFGNHPELIIALFALAAGLHEVVKASVVGSILGNILSCSACRCSPAGYAGTGSSSNPAASAQALMLLLATVALIMPAIAGSSQAAACPDPPRAP